MFVLRLQTPLSLKLLRHHLSASSSFSRYSYIRVVRFSTDKDVQSKTSKIIAQKPGAPKSTDLEKSYVEELFVPQEKEPKTTAEKGTLFYHSTHAQFSKEESREYVLISRYCWSLRCVRGHMLFHLRRDVRSRFTSNYREKIHTNNKRRFPMYGSIRTFPKILWRRDKSGQTPPLCAS